MEIIYIYRWITNPAELRHWIEELRIENDSYFTNNNCKTGEVIYKLFIH